MKDLEKEKIDITKISSEERKSLFCEQCQIPTYLSGRKGSKNIRGYEKINPLIKKLFPDSSYNEIFDIVELDDITKVYDAVIKQAWNTKIGNRVPSGAIGLYKKMIENNGVIPSTTEGTKSSRGNMIEPPISHNIILFGPPGTGKTYHTIEKAVELIKGEDSARSHEEAKRIYDELISEGRIVFTTFHQSMGYEDFIEGIKPYTDDNEQIAYKPEDGIFCSLAKRAYVSQILQCNNVTINRVLSFRDLFDKFIDFIGEELGNGKRVAFQSKQKIDQVISRIENDSIIFKCSGSDMDSPNKVTYEKLRLLDDKLGDLDAISNLSKEFRKIIGGCHATYYWTILNAIRQMRGNGTTVQSFGNGSEEARENDINSLLVEDINGIYSSTLTLSKNLDVPSIPYVLIIDEINRGNVANIFGELITLIEEDKRLGNKEQMTCTLPYSKKKFGVPNNLYIIGTMNTADRSVEALDTALRRRFSFEEMMPRPNLLGKAVDGINLQKFLDVINQRITLLKDREHQIGHSYFINIKSREQFINVIYRNVIPLLQEYFYGDYEKIQMVLGDKLILKEKTSSVTFCIDSEDFEKPDVAYRIESEVNILSDIEEVLESMKFGYSKKP